VLVEATGRKELDDQSLGRSEEQIVEGTTVRPQHHASILEETQVVIESLQLLVIEKDEFLFPPFVLQPLSDSLQQLPLVEDVPAGVVDACPFPTEINYLFKKRERKWCECEQP